MQDPELNDSTEAMLAHARTVDETAREEMICRVVERELPLARAIANRYRNRGEPIDDIVQVASLGLLLATQRYDPDSGVPFAAYAAPTINGEIRRYFRDHAWHLRPPRRIQELRPQVQAATEDLSQTLQRPPTDEEIAQQLKIDPAELREVRRAAADYRPVSLSAPLDEHRTVSDLIEGSEIDLLAAENSLVLGPLLSSLDERERLILQRRFVESKSQAAIAEELGVSQMQISRMLSKILQRFREQISDQPLS